MENIVVSVYLLQKVFSKQKPAVLTPISVYSNCIVCLSIFLDLCALYRVALCTVCLPVFFFSLHVGTLGAQLSRVRFLLCASLF